ADQRGPTISFVKKLHGLGHAQPIDGHARLQGCDLTRNGVRLCLLLRRHAGVYRYLYEIHEGCLLPTCCVCGALSAGCGARACGARRRVMGTTRSYACATQAGLTQLGSNVRRTSRGVLPVRPRRATLASLYLWRGACMGQHALERCPQKPITIPRSQLCSWNARRKLYQHVGNFVGSVVSPLLANIYLHTLDKYMESKYLRGVHKSVQA